jgi:hypothetical protein
MRSCSSNSRAARTMSNGVICGNVFPYGLPLAGSTERGDVEPNGAPSVAGHTMRKRSVSIALRGPTKGSYQPVVGSSTVLLACDDMLKEGKSSTARSASLGPHSSQHTSTSGSVPPNSSSNGPSRRARFTLRSDRPKMSRRGTEVDKPLRQSRILQMGGVLVLAALCVAVAGLGNGLARVPPMGYVFLFSRSVCSSGPR